MKIFKLQLYEDKLDDGNWQRSAIQKPIIIRADNEVRARYIAQKISDKAGGKNSTGELLKSPGSLYDLVECVEDEESGYSVDGGEEVLEPANLNDEF